MADIVNDYFKQFYPSPELLAKAEERSGPMGITYRRLSGIDNVFPAMLMADGFHMSVQGHAGSYSRPREDFAKHYIEVEVGFPSEREELLMPYVEDADLPTDTVYGYVPIGIIEAVIAKHGGLVGPYKYPDSEDDSSEHPTAQPEGNGE